MGALDTPALEPLHCGLRRVMILTEELHAQRERSPEERFRLLHGAGVE